MAIGRSGIAPRVMPLRTTLHRRRDAPLRRAITMFDLAMLALGCGFFVLAIWYASACERL